MKVDFLEKFEQQYSARYGRRWSCHQGRKVEKLHSLVAHPIRFYDRSGGYQLFLKKSEFDRLEGQSHEPENNILSKVYF